MCDFDRNLDVGEGEGLPDTPYSVILGPDFKLMAAPTFEQWRVAWSCINFLMREMYHDPATEFETFKAITLTESMVRERMKRSINE